MPKGVYNHKGVRVFTVEHRRKIGLAHRGEKNWNYKGGFTALRNKLARTAPPKPDRCPICKTPTTELKRGLYLDHDHTTKQFRGWICVACNSVLGFAKDNTEILQAAIVYLKSSRSKQPLSIQMVLHQPKFSKDEKTSIIQQIINDIEAEITLISQQTGI